MVGVVTLRDVARAAGVSTASASRAIARPESVSEELRVRILAAAGRLGYAPNLAARALAARRSGLIGMLIDRHMEQLCAAVVAEIDQALSRAGYSLLVATTNGTAEESLARGREMLGRGVEALISWSAGDGIALEEYMAGRSVPWIVFDRPVRRAPALPATSGRGSGAVLACRYLLSLGHRRFGTVAAVGADIAEEVRAILGADEGTAIESCSVADGSDLDAAQAAAGELLDRAEATAIVCSSDLLALGALRECALRELSVPGEISLVGFGDSPLARCAWPPLTSVRVSAEEIAAATTEALGLLLAGGSPPPMEVGAKLVIRDSTGHVRSDAAV